jgi:hypothetical protein
MPTSAGGWPNAKNDLALYGSIKPGGVAQIAKWPIVVSFTTDATNTVVEVPFYVGGQTALLIEINGRLLSEGSITYTPPSGSARQLTLTFPTAGARTIRIWGAEGLMAVRVLTGGSITKPASPAAARRHHRRFMGWRCRGLIQRPIWRNPN